MKKVIALFTAALVAGTIITTAIPAGADVPDSTITVDVTKEVVNAPQQDATFIIKLTCSDKDDSASANQTVQWHAPGNSPWHLDPEDGKFTLSVTDNWDDDVTCVLSETLNGGAVPTITCTDDSNATCDGASLSIDADDIQFGVDYTYGEFTVVNEFVAPVSPVVTTEVVVAAPAAAVVVSPRFTG